MAEERLTDYTDEEIGFGEPVTVDGVDTLMIVDREGMFVETGNGTVMARQPGMQGPVDNLPPGVAKGTPVVIDGQGWRVQDVQPDGHGWVEIWLVRDPSLNVGSLALGGQKAVLNE